MTGLTRGMGTSETAGTSETSETSETAGTSKTAETAGASATPGTSQVPPNGPVPAYPGVDVGTTDRRRAVSWEDPLAGATLALQLSGLDYLRRILEGEVPPPPIAVLLGMRIVEVEPGRAVFTLDIGEHLYNPIGSVHGGVFSTVLDSAMGCAVHSTLPAGKAYTTLELKVNLVKALTMETPQVRSEGRVISAGRRVATASAQIIAPDGTLFAHATTTCLIFDVPTPKTTE